MRFPNYLFTLLLICLSFTGCATKKITDIDYLSQPVSKTTGLPKLNIFTPKKNNKTPLPVLIFVHGGNWNSGNKGTYGFYGRNFAKKGVITVIPDYTLSPNATYDEMAKEVAAVIAWTKKNIAQYGGNASQVFVTGHSAGGHLAALAVMNPKYNVAPNTIAGIILNDAAALDMKHYLEQYPPTDSQDYSTTWTTDAAKWQDASPVYFIDKNTPPLMIYVGSRTFHSIKVANERFVEKLKPYQPDAELIMINKSHIPMMLQYFWPWNNRYDETINFIKAHI